MIGRIEIEFAIPVAVTDIEVRQLCEIVQRIAKRHEPEGYLHWQSGVGSKPLFSKADARFLGKEPRHDAPESGEPKWDDFVLHIETSARMRYPEEVNRP